MSSSQVRRISALLAVTLSAAVLSITAAPAQALDGPPVIDAVNPQWVPTAGAPVRIYGSGLADVTSVKFGALNATAFRVVDSFLVTASAPLGTNNTLVDVTVADAEGTTTFTSAVLYTDATLTVTPNSGLTPGSPITVSLSGYQPNVGMVLPEVNPLIVYVEQYPDFPAGPPPYAQVLSNSTPSGGFPSTGASGAYTESATLPNPFVGTNGSAYDPNITCPVTQQTANFLGTSPPASFGRPSYSRRCLIATGQFGIGTVDTAIAYTTDPTPAGPVLNLDKTSAAQGEVVSIASGSKNWNANPFFGSSKNTTGRPGETKTDVRICGIAGSPTLCSATVGKGTVKMTHYVNRVLSGATLSGSITVGADIPDGCACFVRVRQSRPGGGYLEATKPLSVT